jgi:hypothetical protein
MIKRYLLLGLMAALCALLAGCPGDEETGGTEPNPDTAGDPD